MNQKKTHDLSLHVCEWQVCCPRVSYSVGGVVLFGGWYLVSYRVCPRPSFATLPRITLTSATRTKVGAGVSTRGFGSPISSYTKTGHQTCFFSFSREDKKKTEAELEPETRTHLCAYRSRCTIKEGGGTVTGSGHTTTYLPRRRRCRLDDRVRRLKVRLSHAQRNHPLPPSLHLLSQSVHLEERPEP